MPEGKKYSLTIQFIVGFGAGVGAGLAMLVLTFLFSFLIGTLGPNSWFRTFHAFATCWGVLSVSLFAYLAMSSLEKRPSVFRAGLATAFAVIMLLDVACWSFQM